MEHAEIVFRLIDHYRKEGPIIVLDSQAPDHPEAKRTLIAARPKAELYCYGNRSVIFEDGKTRKERNNP